MWRRRALITSIARPCVVVAVFIALMSQSARAAEALPAAESADSQFFENRIRPLLAEHCFACHSARAKTIKGQLYLDSRAGLIKGGDSGAAIVAGHPEKSRLIQAVSYTNTDLQMPPKLRLSDAQVADLTRWVERGAVWPGAPADNNPVSNTGAAGFALQKRKASHWAWQPIRNPALPAVQNATWAKSPIDRFILARLESAHLSPATAADRRTLARRLYFDLIGLPPTPEQVRDFANDASPQALEKLVDQLLASPHFGERWARHWLDLARYAETRGHEYDFPIPNAWQYRDYVTRAFNTDVPYNQFATEQIAGDLLEHPRLSADGKVNESVLGTGFWFLNEEVHSPVNIRQDEADRMNNRLDTFSKTFLGLTVGCARCHDHKFDAISTKDYYALTGTLRSSAYRQVPFDGLEQNRKLATEGQALLAAARPRLLRLAADAAEPGVSRISDYVLAAREVCAAQDVRAAMDVASAHNESLDANVPTIAQHAIHEVAICNHLDEAMLARWTLALAHASGAVGDPVHALAVVALDAPGAPAADFGQHLSTHLAAWADASNRTSAANEKSRIFADYTAGNSGFWADGFTFGIAPARAGDLQLENASKKGIGLDPFGAVRRDVLWPNIQTVQSEKDEGVLGSFDRSGRTFRSPTVTLVSGQVWHRIRGAVRIYAAVDSHVMISGPLHTQLLLQVADDNRWRWVHQDLSAYAGQNVHFEFTPIESRVLEVSKIVEADQAPPGPDEEADAQVRRMLSGPSITSPQTLALAFQNLALGVFDDLANDRILGSDDARLRAPLADWLLRHPDLFSNPESAPRVRLAQAIEETIVARAKLFTQVTRQSHTALAMLDGNGIAENVLIRGAVSNPGQAAPRRFLEALTDPSTAQFPASSSGRLDLAHEVFADSDPFPARVMVNRVWQHLFGVGIVASADNFGALGDAPSHPELLDYLAQTFRTQQHWSIKQLIRSIVLSSTYQMSSRIDSGTSAAEVADPRNVLLHRMNMRRLESEAIRDEILAVSGRLDERVGGPSVEIFLTGFMQGRGIPGSSGPLDGDGRRSLYIKVRRNFLSAMMLAYDTPIPAAAVGRRSNSNVPAQALILMNDPFVQQQASLWAQRVMKMPGPANTRIQMMYEQAFARLPTSDEEAAALAFIDQMGSTYGVPESSRLTDARIWVDFAHVLFNVKEFVFVR